MEANIVDWIQAAATVAAVFVALGIASLESFKERARERRERSRPLKGLIAVFDAIVAELRAAHEHIKTQSQATTAGPYIQPYDAARLGAVQHELSQFRLLNLYSAECINEATSIRLRIEAAKELAVRSVLWSKADTNFVKNVDQLNQRIDEIEGGIQRLRQHAHAKRGSRTAGLRHVETFATLTAGALIGWALNHIYYLKAANDAKASAAEATRVSNLLLRGVESVGTIEYARDRDGNVTGVNIRLFAEASAKSTATATLQSAVAPPAKK